VDIVGFLVRKTFGVVPSAGLFIGIGGGKMRDKNGRFLKGCTVYLLNIRPFRFKKGHTINVGRTPWNKGKKSKTRGSNHPMWKGGIPNCKICNKKLGNRYATHCHACSPHFHGENNPNWKGGVTSEDKKLRTSDKTKRWRKEIFEKNNYTCQLCGARSGNGKHIELQAHHILPWREFKRLRHDLENGVALCVNCHNKTKRREFLYIPRFLNV
jgi:hypothetical protein